MVARWRRWWHQPAAPVQPRGQVGRFAGRWMHWREQPGDGPAVVLMSGCGLAMEYWRDVVRLLPGRRVLAYDRPGLGGTRWPGQLPTLQEEVDSLAALLESRGIRDAVLVAHSMAAFHAEALARLRPDLVGAMVMVDGSVESYERKPSVHGDRLATRLVGLGARVKGGWLAGVVWRLGTYWQSTWAYSRLGYGRLPAIYRDPNSLLMATSESFAYSLQAWALQRLAQNTALPPTPVVVLSASGSRERNWVARQTAWAARLGARQVWVDGSRHLMMLDRPEVIVEAVGSVQQ